MNDVDRHLVLGKLRDLVLERFKRARNVCLEDQVEVLENAFLNSCEEVIERDLPARQTCLCLVAQSRLTLISLLASDLLVGRNNQKLARVGDSVEAQ